MPAHNPRHMADSRLPEMQRRPAGQSQVPIGSRIGDDIRALNSSILIISQKIKFLVRNEKILGRNLLVINKKVKDLQESRMQSGGAAVDSASIGRELSSINAKLSETSETLARLESEIENIKQNYAKSEQVSEMKYVVDSINPLEFATLSDLKEAVSGGPAKGGKKK